MNRFAIFLLAGSALLAACESGPTGPQCSPTRLSQAALRGDTVVLNTGMRYIEVSQGSGTALEFCDLALVRYTGRLENGTQFDAGSFDFGLGYGQVIRGFEQGMVGMRVGGSRRLIIPPELGYGNNPPAGSTIPPGATLVFDVELLALAER